MLLAIVIAGFIQIGLGVLRAGSIAAFVPASVIKGLLAAIGRAGLEELDVDRVGLFLNEVLIAENGCRAGSYTEEQGVAAMAPEDIVIRVELHRGASSAAVWTTDFSYDYVRINAEYRT